MTVNKSMIFALIGLAGTVATAIAFAKGGAKADEQIEEETERLQNEADAKYEQEVINVEKMNDETKRRNIAAAADPDLGLLPIPTRPAKIELTLWDKFKLTWKTWVIPGAILGATIGCTIISHAMNWKSITALGGTAAFLAANRDKLEQEIEKRFGKDTLKDIKETVQKQLGPDETKFPAEKSGNGELLCMDAYSGRFFRSSKANVDAGIETLKRYYKERHYVCLNDLYDQWNICRTQLGHDLGWCAYPEFSEEEYPTPDPLEVSTQYIEDGDVWFTQSFFCCTDSVLTKHCNEPVYVINLETPPYLAWMEY